MSRFARAGSMHNATYTFFRYCVHHCIIYIFTSTHQLGKRQIGVAWTSLKHAQQAFATPPTFINPRKTEEKLPAQLPWRPILAFLLLLTCELKASGALGSFIMQFPAFLGKTRHQCSKASNLLCRAQSEEVVLIWT